MQTKSSRARTGEQRVACALVCAGVLTLPISVLAQESVPGADAATLDTVMVTARKREELLVDIPLSITSIDQGQFERGGQHSVADIAPFVPGLNINSDSTGRAFISIRGIGTALQAGVQPGVGIFHDGIYVRETSYINNPLLEVERIEVLRGPQGTLYGKNTLGGAINIISRAPRNIVEGRVYAGATETDGGFEIGARISGPLSGNRLRGSLAVSSREADGYFRNRLTADRADAMESRQGHLSLVWDAADEVYLTSHAYWHDLSGGGVNYSHVDGPTDVRQNIQLNQTSRQQYIYRGTHLKLEFPLRAFDSTLTAIAAWDQRDGRAVGDGDFLALDVVRTRGQDASDVLTMEWRLDTQFGERFSTLLGVFANRERTMAASVQRVVASGLEATSHARHNARTYAVFGTAIWRFADAWEFSAGLRMDRERRHQDTASEISLVPGVVNPNPRKHLSATELQPRVSLTRFFDTGWMMYGSVAKGYRGGGFNGAAVPAQFSAYGGDTVWTYELGAKFASTDGHWSWSNAVYYNDYRDFIGQNALASGPGGGLVSIDLNLGDVESWGLESELTMRINPHWSLHGGVTLSHARITDQSGWLNVTGAPLATDRLLFQPDWNVSLGSNVSIALGKGSLDWNLTATGKGSRPGSSFDPVTPSIMENYFVTNTAVYWNHNNFSIGVYINNLLDEKYFEAYIDGSLLSVLGLLDQNLGIPGAPRTVGMRVQYDF